MNNKNIVGNINENTKIVINGEEVEGNNVFFNDEFYTVDGVKKADFDEDGIDLKVCSKVDEKVEDETGKAGIGITKILLRFIAVIIAFLLSFYFFSILPNSISIDNKEVKVGNVEQASPTRFAVRTPVAEESTPRYAVRTPVAEASPARFAVRTPVAEASTAKYAVRTPIAEENTAKYAVRTPVAE